MLTAPSSGGAVWYEVWRSFDVDPLIAEAVVWPEMERYARLQDYMETAANYGSYVASGGGADFSIGRFQMKPSFVESLEKAWMRSGLARQYGLWFDTADTPTARRVRISRMQKEEWQLRYLGVFLRLLYHCYPLGTLPAEEQVRLAATAYNRGCIWTAAGCGDPERIRAVADEKHFHYAIIPGRHTRRWCYADLAVRHYRKLLRAASEQSAALGL